MIQENSLVDSHCHLDMVDLQAFSGELDDVVQAANSNGVDYLLTVCVDIDQANNLIAIAERYSKIFASVGQHPNENPQRIVSTEELISLANHPKVIAIGETGLDTYRSEGDLSWQQERFRVHIRAAKSCQKPLIIHTRQAREDTLRILVEEQAEQIGGVMHCFTEDWAMAKAALDLNFYISFSGIVTFKNAQQVHEVAQKVPLDRLLIETDAPYLAPVPFRGKANQPAYVYYVAEHLAQLRQVDFSTIAQSTSDNFFTCFKHAQR